MDGKGWFVFSAVMIISFCGGESCIYTSNKALVRVRARTPYSTAYIEFWPTLYTEKETASLTRSEKEKKIYKIEEFHLGKDVININPHS
jgi:hypothetical protein